VWYYHQNRHLDQRNILEDPEINLHSYNHLFLDKGAKNKHWKKYKFGSGKTGYSYVRLNLYLYHSALLNNSKDIKELNAIPDTLKCPQDNIVKTVQDIDIGKNFLNRTVIAQKIRASIDKWDHAKLKSSEQQKK
jgi:hypothetical protein